MRGALRSISGWLAILGLALLTANCGSSKEYVVNGTEEVPGADAEMIVTPLESGNFKVMVDVEHMAPPHRIAEGLRHYVVWIEEPYEDPRRLGHLPLDASREAEMYGTTVATDFQIVVTAEANRDASTPSSHVVLSQEVHVGSET